jgi:hypothetical protein
MQHLTESDLAGYLDRDVSSEDVRRIEQHLDMCDDCRAEIVLVARLLDDDGSRQEQPGRPAPVRKRAAAWRLPAGITGFAAAAAVATVLLLQPGGPGLPSDPAEAERFASEGMSRIETYAPAEGAAVNASELRFAWADQGTDSYRITITAEDGGLVWTQSLADTTAVPPLDHTLASGGRFYWFVDAVSGGVVARSGARAFTVVP